MVQQACRASNRAKQYVKRTLSMRSERNLCIIEWACTNTQQVHMHTQLKTVWNIVMGRNFRKGIELYEKITTTLKYFNNF